MKFKELLDVMDSETTVRARIGNASVWGTNDVLRMVLTIKTMDKDVIEVWVKDHQINVQLDEDDDDE